GNKLTLDNYLLTDISNKFRNQKVKVFIYLPEGSLIYADRSIRHYHRGSYSGLYIPFSDNSHLFELKNEELICLDCPEEEEPENNETTETEVVLTNKKDTVYISADSIRFYKNATLKVKTSITE